MYKSDIRLMSFDVPMVHVSPFLFELQYVIDMLCIMEVNMIIFITRGGSYIASSNIPLIPYISLSIS